MTTLTRPASGCVQTSPGRPPSEANVRLVVRGGEQGGNTTVALDPRPDFGRNPPGHIENALVIPKQVSREDWLMMGDPISQLAQAVERSMGLLARQGAAVRERPTQRWPPECHLIVRLPTSRIEATSGTEQRNPETEREPGYDSRRTWCLTGACRLHPGVGKAIPTCRVKSSRRVVVPGRAVALGEPSVHGVTQCDLQPLQRTVESRAYRRVPRVQAEGLHPVAPRSFDVGAQAFRRERRLQFAQDILVSGEGVDFSPCCGTVMEYTPGPPLPSGMRPGSSLSR